MERKTYTVPEVAKIFGVAEDTVRRWLRSKKLKGSKIGGKYAHWRIPQSEIDRLLFLGRKPQGTPRRRRRH